jgi:drug/metabolite transporter (DMT)-like permease
VRWNLLFAALAASWGFIAVLVAAVDLEAEALAFGRLAIAAVTLALVAAAWRGVGSLRPGGRLPALVLLGTLQASHWLLFFLAIKHGSVALAVLTFYSAPVFIAIAAPLLLHERVSKVALAALVPGAVGIALVCSAGMDGGFSLTAVVAGLGSAVTYAALVIVAKRLLRDRVEPLTVAFWDCLVGSVVAAPVLLAADRVLPSGGAEWSALLLLGVVFTGVATLVYATVLRRVTAQAAGVLTFLEPVAAVLLAAALLDERISARVVAGGALILVSGLVVVWLEPADVTVSEAAAPVGSQAP